MHYKSSNIESKVSLTIQTTNVEKKDRNVNLNNGEPKTKETQAQQNQKPIEQKKLQIQ